MMKAIDRVLALVFTAYIALFAYMLLVGIAQGVAIVQNGLFLWSIGAVFGIMSYRISKEFKRGKKKQYFD